jgi:hypothetical protein
MQRYDSVGGPAADFQILTDDRRGMAAWREERAEKKAETKEPSFSAR